jgi:hypothetical protein
MRRYELNIFYKEEWDDINKSAYRTDLLTIDVYISESNRNGIHKYDTGLIFDCDEFETLEIASQFPVEEYGLDWWIFLDEVVIPTKRIMRILSELPDLDSLGDLSPDAAISNKPVTMK